MYLLITWLFGLGHISEVTQQCQPHCWHAVATSYRYTYGYNTTLRYYSPVSPLAGSTESDSQQPDWPPSKQVVMSDGSPVSHMTVSGARCDECTKTATKTMQPESQVGDTAAVRIHSLCSDHTAEGAPPVRRTNELPVTSWYFKDLLLVWIFVHDCSSFPHCLACR